VTTPSTTKSYPMRMCVGCRSSAPQEALIRLVRLEGGEWEADLLNRGQGRATYVHPEPECWARFERAQRRRIPLGWDLQDLCDRIAEQRESDSQMSRTHGWVDESGEIQDSNRVTARLERWEFWGKALGCSWVREHSERAPLNSESDGVAKVESQQPIYIGRGLGA